MAVDPELLRRSLALVLERAPDLPGRFYRELFARHPPVQQLFWRHAPQVQEAMLAQALVAVVSRIENDAWLEEKLVPLGARHHAYGVTAEMYAWVGETLLDTLAEVAGAAWSEALREQWSEAYGAIVSLMRRGEPPCADLATPHPRDDSSRGESARAS